MRACESWESAENGGEVMRGEGGKSRVCQLWEW